MSQRIWIAPTPGLSVINPADGKVVTEAVEVERDTYWIRRLADRDVLPAKKPKSTTPRPPRE